MKQQVYLKLELFYNSDKVIVLKDANETRNHFALFKYMSDTIDNKLSEDMIKKFHFILKDGALTDSEKEWINMGNYKKRKNFVDNITTTLSKGCKKILRLITKYVKKTFQIKKFMVSLYIELERLMRWSKIWINHIHIINISCYQVSKNY